MYDSKGYGMCSGKIVVAKQGGTKNRFCQQQAQRPEHY